MPGQINKALAKPSGQLSIRFFPPPREGDRGGKGGVDEREKVGVEKEREGEKAERDLAH